MNPREKKEILNNLNEKEFRQDLIIPLLSKMGYLAPIEYHGTNEGGKDIICFEYDRLNCVGSPFLVQFKNRIFYSFQSV